MNFFYTIALFILFALCVTSGPLPNTERLCGGPAGAPTNKVKLSETNLGTTSVDDYQLYFVSEDNQIVFIRTMDGNMYRSADEGRTWTKQTVPELMEKVDTHLGGISRMFFSQVKDGTITIFFLGADQQSLWVSKDGGQNYTYSNTNSNTNTMPTSINWIYVHPMYPGVALGRRYANNRVEIWKCEEYGQRWTYLVGNLPVPSQVAWSIFPSTNPNRIYLLKFSDPENPSPHDGVIIYSDDWFATQQTLSPRQVKSWSIYEPNKFVVVSCTDTVFCSSKELSISDDAGITFNLVQFPDNKWETETEKDFYIWEISDDTIWTYVERDCTADRVNCWGDVFHSNAADKNFSRSLQYNKKWEFTKFNSVDGIYLANQFITKGGIPESGDLIRSLITFDKGSEWNILTAPEIDANGQRTECKIEEGCSLHVHGWSTGHAFTYFYSIPNAVGLMVASGNLGKRLETREDQTSTYVSFHGGVKWQEVRKTDYVPEIGDFGSIVLLVKEAGDTDEVVYTTNDGDEWLTCKFTDNPYDITNIRVSQAWDSRRFIMYGQRIVNGTTHAIITQLNFDDEFTGQCSDADFELWSPRTEHGNCVMGAATNYRRRKKGHNCYLGDGFNAKAGQDPCACTDEDYECDNCFYRQDLASPCTFRCDIKGLPSPPAICNSTGYYAVDMGYRLVDNNKCNKALPGSEKPKGLVPCSAPITPTPVNSGGHPEITSGLSAIPVVIVIVVIILGAIGTVWYLFKNNDSFYNFVSYTFGIEDSNRSPLRYANVEQGQSLAENVDGSDKDDQSVF